MFLMMGQALATHYPPPYPGQERSEKIWVCKTKDAARMWYATGIFQKNGKTPADWRQVMVDLQKEKYCVVLTVQYVVGEVVETVTAPLALETTWGQNIRFYLIKVNVPGKETFFVSTS